MDEGEELMQVEEIIDTRLDQDGKRLYHVKWKPIWVSAERLPTEAVDDGEGKEGKSVYVILDERRNEIGNVEYLLRDGTSTWEPEKKLIKSCPELLSSFWSNSSRSINESNPSGSELNYQAVVTKSEAVDDTDYVTVEYRKSNDQEQQAKRSTLLHSSIKKDPSEHHGNEYQPLFSSLSDMHDDELVYGKNATEGQDVGIVSILPDAPKVNNLNSYDNVIYPVGYSTFHDVDTKRPIIKSTPKKRLCDKCGKYFSTKSNLNRHRKRCDGGRLFYCEICGENFAMSFSLILHQRSHTKELLRSTNGDTLNANGKVWTDDVKIKKDDLVIQNDDQNDTTKKIVPKSEVIYQNENIIQYNNENGNSQCKDIYHQNNDIRLEAGSKMSRDTELPYKTNGIEDTRISKSSIIVKDEFEINDIAIEKSESWKNNNNSKHFTNSYTLSEFQKVPCISTGDRKYECGKCWKQFSTKSNLNRHCKTCNVSKLFKCKVCLASFSSSFNLKIHENIHENEKVQTNQTFSTRHIDRHREIHGEQSFVSNTSEMEKRLALNSGNKRFDVSEKTFKSTSLNVPHVAKVTNSFHIKGYHPETRSKRRYECSKCTKRFSTKSNLNRHVKNCSGAKIFKCNVCTLAFARSVNLKIHQKIHSNDNRYQCKVCKKQCLTSYALLEHERVHTGDRPFRCDDCGRQFTTKSNWKRHQVMYSCRKMAYSQNANESAKAALQNNTNETNNANAENDECIDDAVFSPDSSMDQKCDEEEESSELLEDNQCSMATIKSE